MVLFGIHNSIWYGVDTNTSKSCFFFKRMANFTEWITNTDSAKGLRMTMFVIITVVLLNQGLSNTIVSENYCWSDLHNTRFWCSIIVLFVSGVLCMSYLRGFVGDKISPMWNDEFWLALPIALSIAYQILLIFIYETEPEKDKYDNLCKTTTANTMHIINILILSVSVIMALIWTSMTWNKAFSGWK